MKKLFIGITLAAVMIISGSVVAHAAIPYSQPIHDTGLANQSGVWDGGDQYLGTGLQGTIEQIDVYLASYCVSTCFSFPNVSYALYENTTSTSATGGSVLFGGGVASLPEAKTYYSATGTATLDPDKHYWLTTSCGSSCYTGSGTNRAFLSYGSASDEYDDGEWHGSTATGQEDMFFILWGSGVEGDDTIQFMYPENGTTTNLFSPWLLSVGNLSSGRTYRVDVQWYASPQGTTTPYTNLDTERINSVWFDGSQGETYGIQIPRTEWPFSLSNSSTIHATASLFDTTNPTDERLNPFVNASNYNEPTLTASSSISFVMLTSGESGGDFTVPQFNAGVNTSTITTHTRPVGSLVNPTFKFAATCTEFESGGAKDMYGSYNFFGFASIPFPTRYIVEGALCRVGSWLNDTVAATEEFGIGTVDSIVGNITENVWPLSVFTELNVILDEAEVMAEGNSEITFTGDGDVLPDFTFVALASSTIEWIPNESGFDLRGFIANIMYLMTGIVMVGATLKVANRLFGQDNQTYQA